MFVKNDMLSLAYTLAKCLHKMLRAIIESRYTRGQNLQTLQASRLTFHTAGKSHLIFLHLKNKMPQGRRKKLVGFACQCTMKVMITWTLGTVNIYLVWLHNTKPLHEIAFHLHDPVWKHGAFNWRISDKHSTANVFKLKQQKTHLISFPSRLCEIYFSFENFEKKALLSPLTSMCLFVKPCTLLWRWNVRWEAPHPHLPIWVTFKWLTLYSKSHGLST